MRRSRSRPGHGKIEIFLDDKSDVDRAILQIPELRGFEQFSVGRPVEEMPRITPRICGVCPTAHHMASTKAVDAVFHVQPTRTAKKIRELIYNTFQPASSFCTNVGPFIIQQADKS